MQRLFVIHHHSACSCALRELLLQRCHLLVRLEERGTLAGDLVLASVCLRSGNSCRGPCASAMLDLAVLGAAVRATSEGSALGKVRFLRSRAGVRRRGGDHVAWGSLV